MPKEVFDKDYQYLPHSALLSFEEITRLARIFAAHGVRKIRLTGGEPLLRKNLEVLVEQLAALRTPDGEPLDLTLTTNGSLLARKAAALKAAGLQRVTVSLDGLDDAVFRRMNDVDFPVAEVLDRHRRGARRRARPDQGQHGGQARHQRAGDPADGAPLPRHRRGAALHRVHGRRRHQRLAHGRGAALGRGASQRIAAEFPLVPLDASAPGETAQRWAYARRRRRDRRDQQRDAGLLPRLQPRAPVDRRQALPVPVRQQRPRPARRCCAAMPTTRRSPPPSATSGRAAPTATPNCAHCAAPDTDAAGAAPRRDELHRRMSASTAIAASDITGLVLAGGRGSRMGGVDKGLQNFNGMPLALHALMRLAPQVGEMMINANRNLAAYESFGVPVWPDGLADYAGPLAGFLTGLERCETPYLLTVPCDTPLFPLDLAQRLAEALAGRRTPRSPWSARPKPRRTGRRIGAAPPARVLPAARHAARKPGALHPGRRPQDRRVDRAAPDGAGALRPPGRRARRLLQRQHAGRAARARSQRR